MNARTSLLVVPLLALLVGGCEMMTSPEEDPVYIRMTEMDNRLNRVERVVNNEGLVTLLSRIETLQLDLQSLRSDLEELQYQVQQSGERQRELYLDIDQRLQEAELALLQRGDLGAGGGHALGRGGAGP